MAHTWFMPDAHSGRAFLFLDILADYTLLSVTVMVTPCMSLVYAVGMKLVMSCQVSSSSAFARAPFVECRSLVETQRTIAHKRITKLIPKQFRFGNSSTKITEHNSHSNSVKDSVILCSHYLPRPINSRNKSVRESQSRNYRK